MKDHASTNILMQNERIALERKTKESASGVDEERDRAIINESGKAQMTYQEIEPGELLTRICQPSRNSQAHKAGPLIECTPVPN